MPRGPQARQNARISNSAHQPAALPVAVVSARGAARLRNGHLWVYRSDLDQPPPCGPGALVEVRDPQGRSLGSALYSTSSQIAIRLLARGVVAAEQLLPLIRERLLAAIAYRRRLVENSNAYRVVFSEADGLPGLIVDLYNDVACLQVLTQAMDQPALRAGVIETLVAELAPASILERVEPRIRELEQLPPLAEGLLYGARTATTFTMNGLNFHYDAAAGQKTGAFLDQRENYAAAARYARGRALDVFTYHGGFALHLAAAGATVTAVDSSRAALETAERNAALNQLPEMEWLEANAFDLLRDYADAGRQFDCIVLDPPAFAKSKRTLDTALRGYKELNLRALKMLAPAGILVTCSCSFHVSEAEFAAMLAAASLDAHRSLRVLERRGQSRDHPVLLTVPETAYLKCFIAHVS